MKQLFLFLFPLFFLFPRSAFAQNPSESISSFASDITINQDTSISIKETLNYQTPIQKHGIFRYIPIRYTRSQLSYTARIKDISITDDKNQPIPFTKTQDAKNLTLKIGDPQKTFQGKKVYIITYTTENALQRFADHDELYWDITGEGWQFPVFTSSATITSPSARITNIACYSGPVGKNDNLCRAQKLTDETTTFSYDQTISYNHNFTVVVALDQNGQIAFPTTTQKAVKSALDNLILFPLILPALIFFLWWYFKGRDWIFLSDNVFNNDESQPQRLAPIFHHHRTPFIYEPLTLTPGEAGTMLDEKTDNQDIVAEIIDLARKKYLTIASIDKKGLFAKPDYRFTQLREPDDSLPPHQKYLMEEIFAKAKQTNLSQLKGSFYTSMTKTKEILNQSLINKHLFTSDPKKTRLGALILALILIGGDFFLFYIFASALLASGLPFVIYLIQSLLTLFFALNLPQKTASGTNYMLQAKGLKQTINLGKWREEIKEKHLFIEEILPFAIALGVVDKLAEDMKDLNLPPPSYFHDPTLSAITFSSFVSSFSSATASGLSYNPSSSGWSSGSGFSGGSSGGGGGGGGGGSW